MVPLHSTGVKKIESSCIITREKKGRFFAWTERIRDFSTVGDFARNPRISLVIAVSVRNSSNEDVGGAYAYFREAVRFVHELAVEVVERLHAIQERDITGAVELHVDDVPLGGGDHDARHPFLALEVADVSRHELHARAGYREIECPRVRDVREKEPDDVALSPRDRWAGLAVDEHHVA